MPYRPLHTGKTILKPVLSWATWATAGVAAGTSDAQAAEALQKALTGLF
jgi:hypothetical protein